MRYYSEYAQTWTRAYSIYESIVDPALMPSYKTCEQDKSLNMSRIFTDPIDKHQAGSMIAREINTELTRSNCRDVPRMLQLANQVVNEKAEVMRRAIEATVLTYLTLARSKSTTESRDSSHTKDHTCYQKSQDSFPTARNSGRNDRPAAGGGSASHPSRTPFRRPGDKLMAMREGDDTNDQSVPRAPRDWANDEEWEDPEEDAPLDQEELDDFRQMADRNRDDYDDAYEPGQDDSYQPRAGEHWQEYAQQASEEYAFSADTHGDNYTEQLLFAMHDTPAGEEPSPGGCISMLMHKQGKCSRANCKWAHDKVTFTHQWNYAFRQLKQSPFNPALTSFPSTREMGQRMHQRSNNPRSDDRNRGREFRPQRNSQQRLRALGAQPTSHDEGDRLDLPTPSRQRRRSDSMPSLCEDHSDHSLDDEQHPPRARNSARTGHEQAPGVQPRAPLQADKPRAAPRGRTTMRSRSPPALVDDSSDSSRSASPGPRRGLFDVPETARAQIQKDRDVRAEREKPFLGTDWLCEAAEAAAALERKRATHSEPRAMRRETINLTSPSPATATTPDVPQRLERPERTPTCLPHAQFLAQLPRRVLLCNMRIWIRPNR